MIIHPPLLIFTQLKFELMIELWTRMVFSLAPLPCNIDSQHLHVNFL